MIRVHAGCGSVYLCDGWVNIDLPGPHIQLASDRPDLVKLLSTTEDEGYYARHDDKTIDKLRSSAAKVLGVCDQYGDVTRLPFLESTVDEILARQMFEHLSIREAKTALLEFDRVLKPGGILRIDVPDVEETSRLLSETKDPFFIRHLYGSRKDEVGYHLMGYTRDSLRTLCEEYGFLYVDEERNIHYYPAFCLRFQKTYINVPAYTYNLDTAGVKIPENAFCVDIGPGSFPWPRANEYCDIDPANDPKNGKPFRLIKSITELPYEDKQIDFLYLSHVFEHVDDPVATAKEISRVARSGLVETPHPWREAIFDWEEPTHKWLIWPPKKDSNVLRFWPMTERELSLRDRDAQAALCRLYRNGPARLDHDAILLRKWWYKNQAKMATIHAWVGELKVMVEA